MKILVAVKRVADPNVRITVAADESGVDLGGVRMAMNPFDEIAVEEAVRLKESGAATEVIAVSIGGPKCQDTLRTALAMGADRAIQVSTDLELEPLGVASVLKAMADEIAPQIVILGKQAVDGEFGQTGQMLAAKLGWPQATFASKVTVENAGETITVTREVDDGLETIQADLPCVVTADLRLNAPRFASISAILKAKKAMIEERSAAELDVDVSPRLGTMAVTEPAQARAGVRIKTVTELVDALRQKEGLLV